MGSRAHHRESYHRYWIEIAVNGRNCDIGIRAPNGDYVNLPSIPLAQGLDGALKAGREFIDERRRSAQEK